MDYYGSSSEEDLIDSLSDCDRILAGEATLRRKHNTTATGKPGGHLELYGFPPPQDDDLASSHGFPSVLPSIAPSVAEVEQPAGRRRRRERRERGGYEASDLGDGGFDSRDPYEEGVADMILTAAWEAMVWEEEVVTAWPKTPTPAVPAAAAGKKVM
ncbi:MAG: hypothetical protein Q9220_006808 [cf. Caloplaca sp. 1 TL-2023]